MSSVCFSMMDQEKNKISKEAVCHTKKITQKHAQLTSWLHVCFILFRGGNFNYTRPAHKMQEVSRLFPFKQNSYSSWRINKKKKILSNFLVLCEFLHVGIDHIPLYLIKPPALQSSNPSFSNRSLMLQWQAHTSINTFLHTLPYSSVSYQAACLAIFTRFFH